MSATGRGERGDPLADALRVVVSRRDGHKHVQQDDLAWARQIREVAQVLWMQAGEPAELREEDASRAKVCFDLVRKWSRGTRTLRLLPTGPAPIRTGETPTPRRRRVGAPR